MRLEVRVARRYAKALADVLPDERLEKVLEEVKTISSLLDDRTIKYFKSPVVPLEKKRSLIEQILEKIGADKVIFPERDMAFNLALTVTETNIIESFFLGEDFSIIEIITPDNFVGKKLKDLDLINKYKIQVITLTMHK